MFSGIIVIFILLFAYAIVMKWEERFLLRVCIMTIIFCLFASEHPNLSYLLNSTLVDTIDCMSLFYPLRDCGGAYQRKDKIIDSVMRFTHLCAKSQDDLIIAWLFRTVGEILYYLIPNRRLFILFPDVFQVLYFADSFNYRRGYLAPAIAAKMTQEFYLHW